MPANKRVSKVTGRKDGIFRVLVLTDSFPPCPYAASQRIGSFSEVMSSSGFEVIVLTLFRCFNKRFKRTADRVGAIYDFKYPSPLLRISVVMLNPVIILLLLFAAIKLCITRRPRAVLVSIPQGEVAIVGFLISRLFRAPLVVDLRDWYPIPSDELSSYKIPRPRILNDIMIRLFVSVYKRAHSAVCVDKNIQARLLAAGISPGKILVIPNGADSSIYKPSSKEVREEIRSSYGLPIDKVIFVYAGALNRYYPVLDVIRGAKDLSEKRNDFQFLIISYSDYLSYANYAKEIGVGGGIVKFLGPLPVSETARVLSACDVGVVVYGKEKVWQWTYGSKIFACMSSGLPILASGPSGSVIEELIGEHKLGVFTGSPDRKNFADGFLFFLNNKEAIRKLGKDALKIAQESYDRRTLGLHLVELLKRVSYQT